MSSAGILIFPTPNQSLYYGLSLKASAAFAANVGATSVFGTSPKVPARTYRVDVSLVLTALATSAANAAFNIIATDAAGAYTVPVPLCASGSGVFTSSVNLGAGGVQRAGGSLIFQSSGGTTDVSISITGITTPGSLAGIYTAIFTPIG